jgi:hypothetical protein
LDEKTGKGAEFIDQRIFESFDPSIKKKHLNRHFTEIARHNFG